MTLKSVTLVLGLPQEIILSIADFACIRATNALSQTCRELHNILDPYLWRGNENNALLWATEHANQLAVRKALQQGANINAQVPPTDKILFKYKWSEPDHKVYTQTGATPLTLAIAAGNEDMVRFLLQVDGIDVNRRSREDKQQLPPLILAMLAGDEEMVKLLLGVEDIDTETREGYSCASPLMVASMLGLVEMTRILLMYGAVDPDKGNCFAQSSLFLATLKTHVEIVALLIHAGASPHPVSSTLRGPYGWYAEPVDNAASNGRPEILRQLIRSPRFDAAKLRSPVEKLQHSCIRDNQVACWRLLFAVGCANPNWSEDGRTALWWAAAYGHDDVVRSLLAVDGVDVNTVGRWDTFTREYIEQTRRMGPPGYGEGVTPLIVAAGEGHVGAVQLLLAVDAIDVHASDAEGETALMAAQSRGHEDVVKLIQNS